MKYGNWIAKMVVMGIAAVGLFVLITMLLWNWLVPDLFHGPVINFWQTLGLLILAKIFFFSFSKGHHKGDNHWKPYWKAKWNTMSSEERDRFKQKMKDKWCGKPDDTSSSDSSTSNV